MGKITAVNIGDSGTAAKNKINEAIETVATDASLTGDGNVATPLSVDDTQISITASQVSDFDTEVSNNTTVVANKIHYINIVSSNLNTDIVADAVNKAGFYNSMFNGTITTFRVVLAEAPTGSGATVIVKKNGTLMATVTVSAGSTVGETSSITGASFVKGDVFTSFITAIGSTNPGKDVAAQLYATIN